jgi:Family of unknown function (DUF5763)
MRSSENSVSSTPFVSSVSSEQAAATTRYSGKLSLEKHPFKSWQLKSRLAARARTPNHSLNRIRYGKRRMAWSKAHGASSRTKLTALAVTGRLARTASWSPHMSANNKCRAVTGGGTRCTRKAVTAGFCTAHFPKPKKASLIERAKTVGQVVTTAAGVITLIQKAVELWQSLPFGPGPEMPGAYEYLANEFGPTYPNLPSRYTPGTYGAESIDWAEALDIYNFAKSHSTVEPEGTERQRQTAEMLSVLAERFLDGLPSDFQSMLYNDLGNEGDEGA